MSLTGSAESRHLALAYDRIGMSNRLVGAGVALFLSVWVGWVAVVIAGVVLAGALAGVWYRRAHPDRSVASNLLQDVTLVGVILLLGGPWLVLMVSAGIFFTVQSLVLLARRQAVTVLGYALAWFTASHFMHLSFLTQATTRPVVNYLVGIVFLFVSATDALVVRRIFQEIRVRERLAIDDSERTAKLKSEFVSMVSHELRTPLTSIAGFAEALRDGWEDLTEGERGEFLSILIEQATHLNQIVEDILVVPRLEAGKLHLNLEEFELRNLALSKVAMLFPRGSRQQVAVLVPPGLRGLGDPFRFDQILRNLLENARKYGGDEIGIEAVEDGQTVVVTVWDTGPGVPPEDVERIFNHFEQLDAGDARSSTGVGLGLPIARRLAQAMGGDLWYEPNFPYGSRFNVRIPAAPPLQLAQIA